MIFTLLRLSKARDSHTKKPKNFIPDIQTTIDIFFTPPELASHFIYTKKRNKKLSFLKRNRALENVKTRKIQTCALFILAETKLY